MKAIYTDLSPSILEIFFLTYKKSNEDYKLTVTGLNFSPRNSTQYGSLVPTRLSLASPFRSCFPTTMCFAHSKRFSQLPRRKQRINTSKHTELYKNNSQPLFISSTKDYTIKSVCAMHINRMLHNRGLAAYL